MACKGSGVRIPVPPQNKAAHRIQAGSVLHLYIRRTVWLVTSVSTLDALYRSSHFLTRSDDRWRGCATDKPSGWLVPIERLMELLSIRLGPSAMCRMRAKFGPRWSR
jgi:hypothetical protein